MNERIVAIDNILRILNKNHEIVIKSALPTNETIDVIDFIRQFAGNLQAEQAALKQQEVKPIDNESVLVPSVGVVSQEA